MFTHGKSACIYLANHTATLTSITAYCESVDVPFTADVAETTVFQNTQKQYTPGLKDGTISISGILETAINTIMASALGASKEFEYGPQGSASGSILYKGSAICTNYTVTSGLDGASRFNATLQMNGTASMTSFA
jgi:hypothetical protein